MTSEEVTGLVERINVETSEARHEEILVNGWDTAVGSLYDEVKRTGAHGDYQRLIFESWITDGKDELLLDCKAALTTLSATIDELRQALEPFANAASELGMLDEWRHDEQPAFYTSVDGFDAAAPVTVADFRRADAIRSRTTGDVDG